MCFTLTNRGRYWREKVQVSHTNIPTFIYILNDARDLPIEFKILTYMFLSDFSFAGMFLALEILRTDNGSLGSNSKFQRP